MKIASYIGRMKILMFDIKNLRVEFKEKVLNDLLVNAQTSKGENERGGVLMGELYPKKNLIIVTHIIKSIPKYADRYNFEMDVESTQLEISKIWKESERTITYLGDWHTHPEYSPKPSFDDYLTFTKNYRHSAFDQNFLLYIIVGMLPDENKNLWVGLCQGLITRKLATTRIIFNR